MVGVLKWCERDEIAEAIHAELVQLSQVVVLFDKTIPSEADLIFSYGPYGRLYPLMSAMQQVRPFHNLVQIHWNTENIPPISLPCWLMRSFCQARVWFDLQQSRQDDYLIQNALPPNSLLQRINRRMTRFLNLGDYLMLAHSGLLGLLVDSSRLFTAYMQRLCLPVVYVPWGTMRSAYASLDLERDIDVLWLGKRRTRRRSRWIEIIRRQVEKQGKRMVVVDGVENPFVWGKKRTVLLNRTRLVINLLARNRCDNIFPYRFHIAAGNRAVVVSEPERAHNTCYTPGVDYIETPIEQMTEQLFYYLDHENERREIAENAYRLATGELTFARSVASILNAWHLRAPELGLADSISRSHPDDGHIFAEAGKP